MLKRRSKIWTLSKTDMQLIINQSTAISSILKTLDVPICSSNYSSIKKRLEQDNIDFSHIKLGMGSNLGRTFKKEKTSLDEILVVNSTFARHHLKTRLLKEGTLKNQCSECGLSPEWNSKPLTLQLDHINGISDDNRIENLRIICPNCHTQTLSYAGRNTKRTKRNHEIKQSLV